MKKKLISLLDDSTVSRLIKIVSHIRARCIRPSRNWIYKIAQRSRFPDVKTQVLSHPERHLFFGYYDVSPFSIDDRYALANLGPEENKRPDPNTQLSIGYFDRFDLGKGFIEIGHTETWGWQLGCRLQWYPYDSQSSVLYNKMVDNQYGCVVHDVKTKKIIETYPIPIFTVSHDGRWALSLNFSRLQRLRPGYGFVNAPDETKDQLAPDRNGIWRIDLHSKKRELLFTLADTAAFQPHESMKGAAHYFNHLLFNPSASRFLFMHFWTKDERRFSRLITCDLDGCDWFPIANEGHASHYTWKNERELIVYATHKNSGTHYYQYLDKTNERSIVGRNSFDVRWTSYVFS